MDPRLLRYYNEELRHLREMGADLIAAKEILLEATKEEKIAKKKKEHPLLAEFARNLSELAEQMWAVSPFIDNGTFGA